MAEQQEPEMAVMQTHNVGTCGALAITKPPAIYSGYDAEEEERTYCRSLISPEDLKTIKDTIEEDGYWTIQDIRTFLDSNHSRRYDNDGVFILDADVVIQIDIRTDKCVFIMPDNTVFSREDLMQQYPFEQLKQLPEEIFAQQEVGVFPAPDSYMDKTIKEYQVRDFGADDQFIVLQDEIGHLVKKGYKDKRPAERVVLTKIFLARDGWEDFERAVKHLRSMRRLYENAVGKGNSPLLNMLMGAPAGANQARMLEDAAGLRRREEQLEREEKRLQEKEKELQRMEAELLASLEKL